TAPAPRDLADVYRDGSLTLVVGAGGTILRSTDGGDYLAVDAGTTADLRAVSGRGAEIWVVGRAGTVLRSLDGGAHFAAVPSGTSVDLHGVSADTQGVTLVGDHGTVLVARGDALVAEPSGTGNALMRVHHDLLVGAGGTILRRLSASTR